MDHHEGLALLAKRQIESPPRPPLEAGVTKDLALPRFNALGKPATDQTDYDERHRQLLRAERWKDAEVPPRLAKNAQAILDGSQGTAWRAKFDLVKGKLGGGVIVSITGGYGVGKSQLGACLLLDFNQNLPIKSFADDPNPRRSGFMRFVYAADLFETIKDCFRGDGARVEKVIDHYLTPQLLVIDEVNSWLSQADIRYLHRIACQRYDAMRDTILISNEKKEAFESLVGDRIVSRMREGGGIVEADWPSFRGAKP